MRIKRVTPVMLNVGRLILIHIFFNKKYLKITHLSPRPDLVDQSNHVSILRILEGINKSQPKIGSVKAD